MPSTSRRQHNLMEMIAHGGKPRGRNGPSVKVAKEFVAADKGRNLKALPDRVSQQQKEDDAGVGMVLDQADYRPKKAKRGRIRAR